MDCVRGDRKKGILWEHLQPACLGLLVGTTVASKGRRSGKLHGRDAVTDLGNVSDAAMMISDPNCNYSTCMSLPRAGGQVGKFLYLQTPSGGMCMRGDAKLAGFCRALPSLHLRLGQVFPALPNDFSFPLLSKTTRKTENNKEERDFFLFYGSPGQG